MLSIKQLVRVQTGHRVELVAPEFEEGELVTVVVERCGEQPGSQPRSVVAFLDSLPDGPRAFPAWDEYEKHLQQEKHAWNR